MFKAKQKLIPALCLINGFFFFDTQKNMEKNWEVKTIIGRMNVEVNDYPGSGANNRHTPKRGGGCVEC